MNNSTYPNNPQEAIFVPVQKCPYHVTFDLDLDLEHTVDADLAYLETTVCKFGRDPFIYLGEVMVSANSVHCVHCGQTDCNTSLPRAGEVTTTNFIWQKQKTKQLQNN